MQIARYTQACTSNKTSQRRVRLSAAIVFAIASQSVFPNFQEAVNPVPKAHERLANSWQRVGKGLAKGWRRVGKGLAHGFLALSNIFI